MAEIFILEDGFSFNERPNADSSENQPSALSRTLNAKVVLQTQQLGKPAKQQRFNLVCSSTNPDYIIIQADATAGPSAPAKQILAGKVDNKSIFDRFLEAYQKDGVIDDVLHKRSVSVSLVLKPLLEGNL